MTNKPKCSDCIQAQQQTTIGEYGNTTFSILCKKKLDTTYTVIVHSAKYMKYHPYEERMVYFERPNLDKCTDYLKKQPLLTRFF